MANKKTKTQDFGKKIGGAKKDLWRKRGLTAEDLGDMNVIELAKNVTKNNIWKKPNYEKLVHEDGIPREVVYFRKIVRDSIMAKPKLTSTDTFVKMELEEAKKILGNYITMIQNLKQDMNEIQTIQDIESYYKNVFKPKYLQPANSSRYVSALEQYDLFIDNKLLKGVQKNLYTIRSEIKRKSFCYTLDETLLSPYEFITINSKTDRWETDYSGKICLKRKNSYSTRYFYDRNSTLSLEEAKELYPDGCILICLNNTILTKGMNTIEETKKMWLQSLKEVHETQKSQTEPSKENKKKTTSKYVPKQLEHIQRIGETVRYGDLSVKPEDYLTVFQFRGGEFGNWLSENERIANMNMAYDALVDLSTLLNIDVQDIGFQGELSIAFGARGSGKALAHYEPDRQVINLTKMKGAGSLGHEWIHALDHKIATIEGRPLNLMSEILHCEKNKFPAFEKMIETMKWKSLSIEETLKNKIAQTKQEIETFKTKFLEDVDTAVLHLNQEEFLTNEEKTNISNRLDGLIDNLKNKKSIPYITKRNQKLFHLTPEEVKKNEYVELKTFLSDIDSRLATDQFSRNTEYYGSCFNDLYMEIKNLEDQKMNARPMKVRTQFYKDALYFDTGKSKPYWTSSCEMLARAASAYLAEKAEQMGLRNDYLFGHSKGSVKEQDSDVVHYIYPRNEEMEEFGKAFEAFLIELKEREILHEPSHEYILGKPISSKTLQSAVEIDREVQPYQLREDERGQLGFVFGESFAYDTKATQDMKKMSKAEFLEIYSEYSEDDYDITFEEIQKNKEIEKSSSRNRF